MNLIGLKEIIEQYGMGMNFWRTNLCRSEFNKYVWSNKYIFCDVPEFHGEIQKLMARKFRSNNTKWAMYKYSLVG